MTLSNTSFKNSILENVQKANSFSLKTDLALKTSDYIETLLEVDNYFDEESFNSDFTFYENILNQLENGGLRMDRVHIEDTTFQVNLREQLQNPNANNLFDQEYFSLFTKELGRSMRGKRFYVELNAVGQIDPHNPEYTKSLIKTAVENNCIVGLHLGARLNFFKQTLEIIDELEQENPEIKNFVVLKIFARVSKFDELELIRILDEIQRHNFPKENIRVGLEHIFSLVYRGFSFLEHASKATQALEVYRRILRVMKVRGVNRISAPETRGIATDPKKVFAITNLLLNISRDEGLEVNTFELHFHDDFGQADLNTLSAIRAVNYFNNQTESRVLPVADTTISGGERSGIAGRGLLSIFFGPKFYHVLNGINRKMLHIQSSSEERIEDLLPVQTAGTHIDLIWNKMVEILNTISSQDFSNFSISETFNFYQNPNRFSFLRSEIDEVYGNFLLKDIRNLITVSSLLLYGESIRGVYEDADLSRSLLVRNVFAKMPALVPVLPLNTPVQGKRNILFRLILEGFDINDFSAKNIEKINSFIEYETEVNPGFIYPNHNLESSIAEFVLDLKDRNLAELIS